MRRDQRADRSQGLGEEIAEYGELADAASRQEPPRSVELKKRSEWRLIGTSPHRLDTPAKVAGAAVYGVDVELEGMLVGTVIACPAFGGALARVDHSPALAVQRRPFRRQSRRTR